MTESQRTEFEAVIAIANRKEAVLSSQLSKIATAIAATSEPMAVSTYTQQARESLKSLSQLVGTIETLNEDRR